MTRLWLAGLLGCVLAACAPGADPRPFGLETSKVSLSQGGFVVVGFRVPAPADGGVPTVSVTPPGMLLAEAASLVKEEGAFAGGVYLTAGDAALPGVYSVAIGDQVITATVAELPPATNSRQTTRRSTVAQIDSAGQLRVLTDDGTVSRLMPDGGVERVEGLSGLRAITAGPNGFLVGASLDGTVIDVRGTQGGVYSLNADGTASGTLGPTQAPAPRTVTAVRATFVAGAVQNSFVHHVLDDGTVLGSFAGTIRSALDVTPGVYEFLRTDGVVLKIHGSTDHYAPVFSFPGLRAFEGATFETFSGQTAEYRHHAVWATPDGVAWYLPQDKNPVAIAQPEGVQFVDVFARGSLAYALGDDKRLYRVSEAGPSVRLPFENVRGSTPVPDVGVFSSPIQVSPGKTVTVPLRVVREGYDGALLLTPRAFPADVSAPPVSIAAGATTANLTLTLSADSAPRAQTLEFALTGEGLARTTMLAVELMPWPRRITVAKDLLVKTDGTVWRFTAAGAVQVAGLRNIVSISDNLALDDQGVVYSFGDNQYGQLGRVTTGTMDATPTAVAGLPPIQAIAHSAFQVNVSLALDRDGRVWSFGSWTQTPMAGNETPTLIPGIPAMADLCGDGRPSALDSAGNLWGLAPEARVNLGGRYGRVGGLYPGILYIIGPDGVLHTIAGQGAAGAGWHWTAPNVLWRSASGWAVKGSGKGVGAVVETGVGTVPGSEGSVYETAEHVALKSDGSLWKLNPAAMVFEPMGITGVALTR